MKSGYLYETEGKEGGNTQKRIQVEDELVKTKDMEADIHVELD